MMEEPAGEAPQNDGEQSTLISAPLKLHQIICPDFCIIAFRLRSQLRLKQCKIFVFNLLTK